MAELRMAELSPEQLERRRKEALDRFQHLTEPTSNEERMRRYDTVAHYYDQVQVFFCTVNPI